MDAEIELEREGEGDDMEIRKRNEEGGWQKESNER